MAKRGALLLIFQTSAALEVIPVINVENTRRIPRQQRAQASVDFVLEAAVQVLEATGEAGFNTNAVAERAGVSR